MIGALTCIGSYVYISADHLTRPKIDAYNIINTYRYLRHLFFKLI